MKFIVKQPGLNPEVMDNETITLDTLQHYVEGTVTCPGIPGLDDHGITLWANDDGLMLRMRPNLAFYDGEMIIVGPVMVTGMNDEGETVGLTDEQVEKAKAVLQKGSKALEPALVKLMLG